MDQEQKDSLAKALVLCFEGAIVFIYGVYFGIKMERRRKNNIQTTISCGPTSAILMTVGMNALVDEIYDEDELRYMIEQADIKIKEDDE